MSDQPIETPTSIGPFRVIRPLARGGMAAVYEVEDPGSGRRVALKLLTQRGLARPRFDREYRSLTRLDHPNIVRVYQFGLTPDGQRYLTMELLEGEAAQVHVKAQGRPGTPLRTTRALRIVEQVALALAYLHDRGLVHRDLKSSNVLVLEDGTVKLLDFGTARLLDPDDEITRHGEFVGTFAYAAPEQLTGGRVDARADLYSLGVLLYRLLTGKRPFEGDSPHALARLHLEHTPPPPGELVAGVPAEVSALVMRLLAKDPAARPSSAWVVYESLRALDGAVRGRVPGLEELCAPEVVGREGEVARLRALLDDPTPGRMAVVVGDDGTGRERLLLQVADDARKRRMSVYGGSFPGGPGIGALVAVGRELARGLAVPGGRLADPDVAALADVAVRPPDGPGARAAIAQAFVQLVRRRAARSPKGVVLTLSELHRAPALALDALAALREAAVADALPVAIVVSLDPGDTPHAVDAVTRRAVPIVLGPLDPVQVGRLLGAVLGRRAPPPALVARLHDATGGLPGHVVSVVHALVREGLVVARRTEDDRVVWLDRTGGRLAVPEDIRDRVGLRIDALPRPALRVLEALAAAAIPVDAGTVAHAVDRPRKDVARSLASLAAAGLATEQPDGWAPRMGLIGQLVRERTRASRRTLLQGRLAAAAASAPASVGKLRLQLSAGQLADAVTDAVDLAPRLLADHRAVSVAPVLARLVAALDGAPEVDVPPEARWRVTLLALEAAGCVDPSDPRALDALMAATPPDSCRAASDLLEARLRRHAGDGPGASAALGRARGRLRRFPDPHVGLAVDLEQGRARALQGDAAGALLAFQVAGRGAEERGDLAGCDAARLGVGLARFALGQLEACESDLDRSRDGAARRADAAGVLHATVHLAEVYRVQGRYSEALDVLEPHLDRVRVGERPFLHARVLLTLSSLGIELFRLGEVRELLIELDAIEVCRAHPWLAAELARLRGRLLLASRDPAAAVGILRPAVDAVAVADLPVAHARLQAWLAQGLAALGPSEEADRLLDAAIATLGRARHLPILAEVCARRAVVALGTVPPEVCFRPVLGWVDQEPARLSRLEWLAAALREARRTEQGIADAAEALHEALEELGALLEPRESAALRVHPWRVAADRVREPARR